MSETSGFGERRFLLSLPITMVVFFAAARLLPPVETGTGSLAVAAGYTNQLRPLLIILLTGGLVMGALGLQRGAALPLRIGASIEPVQHWRWHLAAACLICVLQVFLFPTWTQEAGYFGTRLALMDTHLRPYVDFEFAYGYALIYVPYALHWLGFSIHHALVLALGLAVVIGVLSIGVIVRYWIADARLRMTLFWALVVCDAFVLPGPSMFYNFGRYAAPFAMLLLLTRHGPALDAVTLFLVTAVVNLLAYSLSAEMGIAFGAAALAWATLAYKALPKIHVIAVAAAVVADLAGLIIFARPMFTTFLAFSQIQIIEPVVPHLIMLVVVVSFLTVCAVAVPAAVTVWRTSLDRAEVLTVARACACAALAVAMFPAVIGRSWPTTTLAYGFPSVVMAVGYFEAAGAKRTASLVTILFVAFVAYCGQFVVRDDLHHAVVRLRARVCTVVALAQCQSGKFSRPAATVPAALRKEIEAAWPQLAQRFPHAYDPMGFIGYQFPHTVDFGYYPGIGQGNAITKAAFARKTAELRQAPYYILPRRNLIERRYSHTWYVRTLREFARKSLFPFTFHVKKEYRHPASTFVDMLYRRCRPLAEQGGITVCAAVAINSH